MMIKQSNGNIKYRENEFYIIYLFNLWLKNDIRVIFCLSSGQIDSMFI